MEEEVSSVFRRLHSSKEPCTRRTYDKNIRLELTKINEMTVFRSASWLCVVVWIPQLVCGVAFYSNTSSISQCQDHIDENDCEFYRCIEARMQCGEEGYPLRYGYKYCQRFTEHSRHFNIKVSLYYVSCSCSWTS